MSGNVPDTARFLVHREISGQLIETGDDWKLPQLEDVYVVWFCYILGGWKALVSTTLEDGKYYEVTCNPAKGEIYVDTYVKQKNTVYSDKE